MIDEQQIVPYHTLPLPVAQGPWLVFAPHADDESFGMAGTLIKANAAGIVVHLVVLTDGALGGQQHNLVNIRQQEAQAAAAMLGVASVVFLGQPDRWLQVTDVVAAQIVSIIANIKPAAVFFPGVLEPHPDHRACALLVWQALQSVRQSPASTPIPTPIPTPAPTPIIAVSYEISVQSPINCLVDITQEMERKKQVIAGYVSQLGQNNYVEMVQGLNRLRTFSLSAEVVWAEGFYRFSDAELAGSLPAWLQDKMSLMLANT